MHRIAAALLIVAAVFAFNGGMLRDAFAKDAIARLPAPRVEAGEVLEGRSARILSLLVALEALRAEPAVLTPQKG